MNRYFMLYVFLLFCACNQPSGIHHKAMHPGDEALLRANRIMVEQSDEIIRNYLNRRQWKMLNTPEGLWYMIYETKDGMPIQSGNTIQLKCRIEMLDGTICYDEKKLGIQTITVGEGKEIKGLEKGLPLLRIGDKARFIIPPHLGYGMTGDQDRIPPGAILLYDIEIVGICKK